MDTAPTKWEDYWPEFRSGKHDIFSLTEWHHFMASARNQFAGDLFEPSLTPRGFVKTVIERTLAGDVDTPGLYTAQQICKYGQSSADFSDVEVHWFPSTAQSSFDALLICQNLNVSCGDNQVSIPAMEESELRPMELEMKRNEVDVLNSILTEKDPLTLNSPCSSRGLYFGISQLALFLGDGAIGHEVDAYWSRLEGGFHDIDTCFLANLTDWLSQDTELCAKANLDQNELIDIHKHLIQSSGTLPYLSKFVDTTGNSFKNFETGILRQLKMLDVGEHIFMLNGFYEHAMALILEKNGRDNYSVIVINSGSGLNYHQSYVQNSKVKYFPGKRYSNLTLMDLAWSQVFERLGQIYAMSNGVGYDVETRVRTSPKAKDLYENVFGVLQLFETPYTEEDLQTIRVILEQLSGTCTANSLLAYVAYYKRRPFRTIKVFLYKDMIELSLDREWLAPDEPMMKRLLKFGIENYARTVRRFIRDENKELRLDPKTLLPQDIWEGYDFVKDVYKESKATKFSMDTSDLQPSRVFYDHIMSISKAMEIEYDSLQHRPPVMHYLPTPECKDASSVVFGYKLDIDGFADYCNQLKHYALHCTLMSNAAETMQFLTTTIVSIWPEPNHIIWSELLNTSGLNKDRGEKNMFAIWSVVEAIIEAQNAVRQSNLILYTAMHKLLIIFQNEFAKSYEDIQKCITRPEITQKNIRGDFGKSGSAYLCLSTEISEHLKNFAVHNQNGGADCFSGTFPAGYFLKYLMQLEAVHSNLYQDVYHDYRVNGIARMRRHPDIPIVMYYWRILSKFTKRLGELEFMGWSLLLAQNVQPTNDMLLDEQTQYAISDQCDSAESILPSDHPLYRLNLNLEIDSLLKTEDLLLSTKEELKMASTVLRSHYDRLGTFDHTLHVSLDLYHWSSALFIGAQAMHGCYSKDSLNATLTHLATILEAFQKDLIESKILLQLPAENSPDLKRKCEVFSALSIIESNLGYIANRTENTILRRSKLQLLSSDTSIHESYQIYFVFAFLASSRPSVLTPESAAEVISGYRRLYAQQNLLPNVIDKSHYMSQIRSKLIDAIYVLGKAPNADALRLVLPADSGELIAQEQFSAVQVSSHDYIVDMLSGGVLIAGIPSIEMTPETLNQYYKQSSVSEKLSKLRFTSITQKFYDANTRLVTATVLSGSKKFTEGPLVYDLEKVEFFIGDEATFIIETYATSDPDSGTVKRVKGYRMPSDLSRAAPIPAPVDKIEPYCIIAFPKDGKIGYIDAFEHIWAKNGLLSFSDSAQSNLHYMEHPIEAFISPLSEARKVQIFQADLDKSTYMLLRDYGDTKHKPLWFHLEDDGNWHYLNDRKFYIPAEQDFLIAHTLKKYLLIENEFGAKKLILPLEHYTASAPQWCEQKVEAIVSKLGTMMEQPAILFDESNLRSRKQYRVLSMANEPHQALSGYLDKISSKSSSVVNSIVPKPNSRQESLLLAYNYLATRHYRRCSLALKLVHQMEPFHAEELRLLGWIFESDQAIKDGSPDSLAIRTWATFLVFANDQFFDTFQMKSLKLDDNIGVENPSDPYRPVAEWLKFWIGKYKAPDNTALISKYISHLRKIPRYLRIDPDSNNKIASNYAWRSWIGEKIDRYSVLGVYLKAKNSPQIDMPIWGRPPASKFSLSPGEQEKCKCIIADFNIPFTKLPTQFSFIKSEALKDIPRLACQMIAGHHDNLTRERLLQTVQGIISTGNHPGIMTLLESILMTPISAYEQQRNKVRKDCKVLEGRWRLKESSECNDAFNDLMKIFDKTKVKDAERKAKIKENAEFKRKAKETRRAKKALKKVGVESWGPSPKPITEIKPVMLTTPELSDELFKVEFSLAKLKGLVKSNEEEAKEMIIDIITKAAKEHPELGNRIIGSEDLSSSSLEGLLLILKRLMKAFSLDVASKYFSLIAQRADSEENGDVAFLKALDRLCDGEILLYNQDIIYMYAMARADLYQHNLPQFSGDVQKLHEIGTKYVLAFSNAQEIGRLRKAYIVKDSDPRGFEQEVFDRIRNSKTTQNIILAYECFLNSRLTMKQVNDALRAVEKTPEGWYHDLFLQWIMSAGKTLILGTLLSVMKADREHLSILIVPKALLTGEATNLISRTIGAFGRVGFSFRIARDPHLTTVEKIRWLKEAVKEAIAEGRYLIMSVDMLLNMHNKLIELGKDSKRKEEFDEMRELLDIFEKHGAVTVDEAHKIFEPTQETNFPIIATLVEADGSDTSFAIESKVLTEAFRVLLDHRGSKWLGSKNICINIPLIEKECKELSLALGQFFHTELLNRNFASSQNLLSEADWLSFEGDGSDEWRRVTLNYLTVSPPELKTADLNRIKAELTPTMFRALSVLRMATVAWIPLAWSGNINENYGLSPKDKFAIPYAGAFAPKYGSEFAFRWFCYVRTIRSYLVSGFDQRTVKWLMIWLQNLSFMELGDKKKLTLDSWPEKVFQILFGLDSPFKLNINSTTQMNALLEKIKRHHQILVHGASNADEIEKLQLYKSLLFKWLAEDALPSVEFYRQQISTNSQDASYMVNSLHLYAGSYVSLRNFPKAFLNSKNVQLDDSVDPSIKKAVLERSSPELIILPSGLAAEEFVTHKSIVGAMEAMNEAYKSPLSAVIDVGAFFKDQKNEEVAESLLKLQEAAFYFSTDRNKLALITNENKTEKLLDTYSAEIIEGLIADATMRVTFYDQQHTTGIDIFQTEYGFAFVIIGVKTTSTEFYQAVMRMRKLRETQRLVIVLPENVAKIVGKGPLTVLDVVRYMEKNLKEAIINLNSMSLMQMITANYRQEAYRRVLAGTIDLKVLDIWIKDTANEIENIVEPQRPHLFREKIIPSVITKCENQLKPYINGEDLANLRKKAEMIVKLAYNGHTLNDPLYPKECMTSDPNADDDQQSPSDAVELVSNLDTDQVAVTSVEVDTDIKMETENELENYPDTGVYDGWMRLSFTSEEIPFVDYRPWIPINTSDKINGDEQERGVMSLVECFDKLFKRFVLRDPEFKNMFSERLLVSTGFACTSRLIGKARNYIPHALLLMRDDAYYMVLVDGQEAEEVSNLIDCNRNVFGHTACLMDPVRQIIKCPSALTLSKKAILERFDKLIWESIAFAGYLNVLCRDEARSGFEEWLGTGSLLRTIRTAALTDVFIAKEEHQSKYIKKIVQHSGVNHEDFKKARKYLDVNMLHYWTGNMSRLSKYFGDIQEEDRPECLKSMIEIHMMRRGAPPGSDVSKTKRISEMIRKYLCSSSASQLSDLDANLDAVRRITKSTDGRKLTGALIKGALCLFDKYSEYEAIEPYFRVYKLSDLCAKEPEKCSKNTEFGELMKAMKKSELLHLHTGFFASLVPQNILSDKAITIQIDKIMNRKDMSKTEMETLFRTLWLNVEDPSHGFGILAKRLFEEYRREEPPEDIKAKIYEFCDYERSEGQIVKDSVSFAGIELANLPWFSLEDLNNLRLDIPDYNEIGAHDSTDNKADAEPGPTVLVPLNYDTIGVPTPIEYDAIAVPTPVEDYEAATLSASEFPEYHGSEAIEVPLSPDYYGNDDGAIPHALDMYDTLTAPDSRSDDETLEPPMAAMPPKDSEADPIKIASMPVSTTTEDAADEVINDDLRAPSVVY